MKRRLTFLAVGAVLALGGSAHALPLDLPFAAAKAEKIDVLISFKQQPGLAGRSLVESLGGSVRRDFSIVPALAASLPEAAIDALSHHPLIEVIENDGVVYALDAELDNTWGVKRIGADTAHAAGRTGEGVKVAVIDTGVDYAHAEIAANYKGGYDFVNNDSDPRDDNGHGTHVAGTIAALDNDAGVVGVSPDIELYALKVLAANGSGSFSDIIAALEWAAENGVQVTNNSYGSSQNPGTIVEQAFNNAAAAGVFHVAAAGNTGRCNGKGNTVGYPAAYASVVAVAAVDQGDNRACFSSTGPTVELSAPGVAINSTRMGGGYHELNGTSMASPHVAGVAALAVGLGLPDYDLNGIADNNDLRALLQASAIDRGTSGRDSHYGFGVVHIPSLLALMGGAPVTDPEPDPEPTPPVGDLSVRADSIVVSGSGGRTNDRHVNATISVVDQDSAPMGNTSVEIKLLRTESSANTTVIGSWSAVGTTGSNGKVAFTLNSAPTGCYAVEIVNITADGYAADTTTPTHSAFCK